jgi:hypothetical protein
MEVTRNERGYPFEDGVNSRIALAIGVLVFALTYWFAPNYTAGDQSGYGLAYSIMGGLGLGEARNLYEQKISGSDYFHNVLIWMASTLEIGKNTVMSIANGFLAAYAWQLFCKWGADGRIAGIIVLSNFYMLVLYFAAERLKFGILFVVLSLIWAQSFGRAAVFAILAAASHVTALGVGIGFWIREMALCLRKGGAGRYSIWGVGLAIVLILGILFIERAMIMGKWNTYISSRPEFHAWDITPAILMFAGAIYYSRQIADPLLKMGPLLVAIYFLGGSRLNMLLYFVFLYYALRVRGGFNVGVMVTSVYLGWKSVLFVQNVLRHGDGFAV